MSTTQSTKRIARIEVNGIRGLLKSDNMIEFVGNAAITASEEFDAVLIRTGLRVSCGINLSSTAFNTFSYLQTA